ncbi:CpsD/CapB family tyrosine-protein kinase [Gracilimonas sediminicola]|uniref:CpsD/CapB family tyrosine-protein kinase n=1 Tax=Gracilimonas sediminicola TaxID=2952158 RepID=UPI0038D4E6C1
MDNETNYDNIEQLSKARRAYVSISGILLAWLLIGVDLQALTNSSLDWIKAINSPEAIPIVLMIVCFYLGYRYNIEALIFSKKSKLEELDYYLIHFIGLVSVGLSFFDQVTNYDVGQTIIEYIRSTNSSIVIKYIGFLWSIILISAFANKIYRTIELSRFAKGHNNYILIILFSISLILIINIWYFIDLLIYPIIISSIITGIFFYYLSEENIEDGNSLAKLFNDKTPYLGSIPDFKDAYKKYYQVENKRISGQLISFLDHISPITNIFHLIVERLNILNTDTSSKTLLVTGDDKSVGKSSISTNIAVILTEKAQKVLLIDCDMRRPSVHLIFGEFREPGLTELLFDPPNNEVIIPSIVPGLDLLTVGKKYYGITSVLNSEKFGDLIRELKSKYEYIIFDTPPVNISDVHIIKKYVDSAIFVTSYKNKGGLEKTINSLNGFDDSNIFIEGVIVNYFQKYIPFYTYYTRYYSYS